METLHMRTRTKTRNHSKARHNDGKLREYALLREYSARAIGSESRALLRTSETNLPSGARRETIREMASASASST